MYSLCSMPFVREFRGSKSKRSNEYGALDIHIWINSYEENDETQRKVTRISEKKDEKSKERENDGRGTCGASYPTKRWCGKDAGCPWKSCEPPVTFISQRPYTRSNKLSPNCIQDNLFFNFKSAAFKFNWIIKFPSIDWEWSSLVPKLQNIPNSGTLIGDTNFTFFLWLINR